MRPDASQKIKSNLWARAQCLVLQFYVRPNHFARASKLFSFFFSISSAARESTHSHSLARASRWPAERRKSRSLVQLSAPAPKCAEREAKWVPWWRRLGTKAQGARVAARRCCSLVSPATLGRAPRGQNYASLRLLCWLPARPLACHWLAQGPARRLSWPVRAGSGHVSFGHQSKPASWAELERAAAK